MERIKKYEARKFKFDLDLRFSNFRECSNESDLTFYKEFDNYIKINRDDLPFLVYKYGTIHKEINGFDKLTLLGKVFERMDILCSYNLDSGKVLLCDVPIFEYNLKVCDVYVANMKNIFEKIFNHNGISELKCDSIYARVLEKLFRMKHILTKCNISTVRHREPKVIQLILINYEDLNDELKLKYDALFETKICDKSFLTMDSYIIS